MAGAAASPAADAAAVASQPARQAQPQPPAPPPAVATGGRIKYADPRSLPSFPSSGLAPGGAAASAAASLGWSNQKPVELWKPDKTSSASAAAVLAKDYKMSPSWEPAANPDGHRAAVLAVGSAGAALKQSAAHKATPTSHSHETWGSSAATQAFHAASRGSQADAPASLAKSRSLPDRSLVAAKGAMSGRASSPLSATGLADAQAAEASAASSALRGATRAHRASMQQAKPSLHDVGAVPVTTMTRNMFTSHPHLQAQADEQSYNERLHQSAVDMARNMYQRQQRMLDQAKAANGDEPAAGTHLNLQDAAYKQAQERLAKLHDEHQQSREYQAYYGNQTGPRRKLSVASRLRRRSLPGHDDLDDRKRSDQIREQMSMFSTKLSQVDREKRAKDREALLAAAQRNVKARLQGMDERVYRETGRVNPSLAGEWELKAQQAAQARHEGRSENKDKVDIGGGMFMTRDEVDAIAAKRVQPVLDDINEKAEAERERRAVLKMEEEARREEGEKQKARDREIKEMGKKTKEQEKQEERAKKMQEKHDEKVRREEERAQELVKRDEEKAAKAEQKRLAREEKRRSKHEAAVGHGGHDDGHDDGHGREHEGEGGASDDVAVEDHPHDHDGRRKSGSSSSNSPTSKVKGWIRNRFSHGKSMSETGEKRRSFLGGAAMREHGAGGSTQSLEKRTSSMRDVALAGKGGDEGGGGDGVVETGGPSGTKHRAEPTGFKEHRAEPEHQHDSRSVSPVSAAAGDERQGVDLVDDDDDERNGRCISIEAPRPIEDAAVRTSSSPTRDSRFREEMDR